MTDRALYEVQQILGRKVFSGKVLYLVQWKNFPSSEATWQSVKVLKNVKHLVKQYHDKQKRQSKRQPRDQKQGQLHNFTQNNKKTKFTTSDSEHQKQALGKKIQDAEYNEKLDTCSKETQQEHTPNIVENSKHQSKHISSAQSHSKDQQQTSQHQGLLQKSNTQQVKNDQQIKLKKIYFLQKTAQSQLQYLIEQTNGTFRKCLGSQLVQKYPCELVKYLEEALLLRLAQ